MVRPSSTSSNMNISSTSGLITTKFYLKHHWVGGNPAIGYGPDQIRTLVSIATESFHRNGENSCHFFSAVFHPVLFILAGNDDMHESSQITTKFHLKHHWVGGNAALGYESLDEFEICQIRMLVSMATVL